MSSSVTYKLTHKMFYEGLKEGKLLGLKCNSCNTYTCPPKINCAQCNSLDMDIVELNGKAEIKTFTVVRVCPEGFEGELPYVVALAELEEGPWVCGRVVGVDPDKVTMDIIGKKATVGGKIPPKLSYAPGEPMAITLKIS